ncbi:MAG TPA: leucyl aminopeptidase [Ideonella sp.]|nr:leucyl aminopeptidase [Ideonella sp.]
MDFRVQGTQPDALAGVACDALVLAVGAEQPAGLDPALASLLADALAGEDFQLKPGRALYLHRPAGVKAPRLVLAAAPEGTPKAFRAAVGAALALLKGSAAHHVAVALAGGAEAGDAHAEAFVLAVGEALYTYRHTKPSAPKPSALSRATLLVPKAAAKAAQQGLARGEGIAAGVTLAREWANRPGNHCRPRDLADEAKRLGKSHGLKVEVLERKQIEALGMGAFLAVTQGSEEPPRFIVMRYDGAAKGAAPVVLVGKGITFDTGGISIKPSAEMDEMKFDMGGAASVLGTMRAVAELKPKVNVVGIVPSCENMPDGRAVKPGDVVTSMSGQTIEILNTDAEGRLILCDALTYAERMKPAAVIDIATLTGACVIALGHHRSGLFCADDALAQQLQAAGEAGQDPCWRMPLDDEYDEALKSNFADMGNVGGRAGGAITAAMFLKRFTAKYSWAHLDIAGTAWRSGAAKGATGRPVSLLTHFVLARAR